jgi:thiosulfate reductase cytochrome b subunit
MSIINNTSKSKNLWLKITARISAWALLVCVAILVLSGWGITQTGIIYKITFGLVDRHSANTIHTATILPLVFFFLLHVMINIRLGMTNKNRLTGWLINGVLLAIGGFILYSAIYMEYFRLGG